MGERTVKGETVYIWKVEGPFKTEEHSISLSHKWDEPRHHIWIEDDYDTSKYELADVFSNKDDADFESAQRNADVILKEREKANS